MAAEHGGESCGPRREDHRLDRLRIDSGCTRDHSDDDVILVAARGGEPERNSGGIFLEPCDQILRIADRGFGAHGRGNVFAHDDVERRHISEAELAGADQMVGDDRGGQHGDVVRIARMLRHERERHDTRPAGAVHHGDARHPRQALQHFLHQARLPVGRTAGAGVHHDLDSALGIPLLRASRQRNRKADCCCGVRTDPNEHTVLLLVG
jgi:hypothetical protein